jgi:hypothetical protein
MAHLGNKMLFGLLLVIFIEWTVAWRQFGSENVKESTLNQRGKGWYEWKRQEQSLPTSKIWPRASIGPTKSEIINSTWLYIPGFLPSGLKGDLVLWSGLYNDEHRDEGDSLQVTIQL